MYSIKTLKHMQMTRYNAFSQIHKGLRALLYDTAIKVQQTDFTDDAAAAKTIDRLNTVVWLFESHAHVEDTMVFPMVQQAAPEIVEAFEKEHVTDHELGEALKSQIEAYRQASDTTEKIKAGTGIFLAFNDFIAFNLYHMNKEETIINKFLWENYTDADLIGLTQRIVASVPPNKNEQYSRWMLKGIGLHETIHWYQAIRATAPPPVFEQFCIMAEEELPFEKWVALKSALKIDEQAAAA